MQKKGVLLINLGTPDNCHPRSVYRYLKEFLNDPRVIDLPAFFRWILTNIIIVPSRFKKSAKAYQQIWTESGSPLWVNSEKLKNALALALGDNYQVELAMRYGKPTLQSVQAKMKNCESIHVIPLFPQYSSAATGSAIEHFIKSISKKWNFPSIKITNHFYNHPGFITAYSEIIKKSIANQKTDLILFSYHGLPERHIVKSHCRTSCHPSDACPKKINELNAYCYRAQCYKTSELLAEKLGLKSDQYAVAFQSRLGRTPWIKPYTDLLLPELRKNNIETIVVVCPSFVADCLETLEEVNIRTRKQWLDLGGKEFVFIPCLNDHPTWVNALASVIYQDT